MASKNSIDKVKAVELKPSTRSKLLVWYIRVFLRDILKGKDVLDSSGTGKKIPHQVYRKADEFIAAFFPQFTRTLSKKVATKRVRDMISEIDYTIVEMDETKPWGAYYRLHNDEAERFVHEFFPGLTMKEARLGHDDIDLSPKFLLVAPGQRLSWQLHHRRAERWRFLNKGAYFKSSTDKQGKRLTAEADTIVQFEQGERHRLCAFDDQNYTLVAEIWQHTMPDAPSNEADIVRIEDDYSRSNQP